MCCTPCWETTINSQHAKNDNYNNNNYYIVLKVQVDGRVHHNYNSDNGKRYCWVIFRAIWWTIETLAANQNPPAFTKCNLQPIKCFNSVILCCKLQEQKIILPETHIGFDGISGVSLVLFRRIPSNWYGIIRNDE